jgi:putative transposase
MQSKSEFKLAKRAGAREKRKTDDVIHKVTRKIVEYAKENNAGIRVEDLTGIRKNVTRQFCKENNYTLNSWPFHRIRTVLAYKAKERGVELQVVDPRWTSAACSRCGHTEKENRKRKVFRCLKCGHLDHADVNAAFNVASRQPVDLAKKEIRKRGQGVRSAHRSEVPVGQSGEHTGVCSNPQEPPTFR